MWSRLKWFSLSQIKFLAGLVFLLFAQHLVSQSWNSVITKVGIVGHRAGHAVGLVVEVVDSWDSSVVEGGDWGAVVVGGDWSWNSSVVVVGSHNWGSYGNGLLQLEISIIIQVSSGISFN